MEDDTQNTDTSPTNSLPTPASSVDVYKQPILPYVFDFMKYVAGFAFIVGVALVIIQKVALY